MTLPELSYIAACCLGGLALILGLAWVCVDERSVIRWIMRRKR